MLAQTVYAAGQAPEHRGAFARADEPEPAPAADDSECFSRALSVSLPVVLFRMLILIAFFCTTTSLTLLAVSQVQLSGLRSDHQALFDQAHQESLLLNDMWIDVQELPAASGIMELGDILTTENSVLQAELIDIHSNVTTLSAELALLVALLQQRLGR